MLSEKKFAQLFDEYVDDVSAFLHTYTSNKALLKDWVQEVFIKIWDKRDSIDFSHPAFKSYLLKTARNHALKQLRKEKKYSVWLEEHLKQLTKVEPPEGPKLAESDIHKTYHTALTKISLRARKAYQLSREEGLTYPEIAEVMDVSIKTVEAHISKALSVLRQELKEFIKSGYRQEL